MNLTGLTPILYASDFARSMDYFVDKLGFRKLWDWGTPPTFGGVGRDHVELFLSLGAQGQPGTWMSVFVHDVDDLHEELVRRGAVIKSAPEDKPWGMREMHVECPDGHILRFGHGISTVEKRVVERRDVTARVETRLLAVLEELAALKKNTLGELLEDIVLHSFERVEDKDGHDASAAPYTTRTFELIAALKKKHGVDYEAHANYGFIEKPGT
jgi:catechol 2,3-dioxygenase-like lactoylglutathione lyase family enzyme